MPKQNIPRPRSSVRAINRAVGVLNTQRALAKAIGVTPGFVGGMCRGERPIPAELCKAIEKATAGRVLRKHLRPDLFGDLQ